MPGLLETLHRLLDLVSASSINLIGEVYPPLAMEIPAPCSELVLLAQLTEKHQPFWLPSGYYFITKLCGTVSLS